MKTNDDNTFDFNNDDFVCSSSKTGSSERHSCESAPRIIFARMDHPPECWPHCTAQVESLSTTLLFYFKVSTVNYALMCKDLVPETQTECNNIMYECTSLYQKLCAVQESFSWVDSALHWPSCELYIFCNTWDAGSPEMWCRAKQNDPPEYILHCTDHRIAGKCACSVFLRMDKRQS